MTKYTIEDIRLKQTCGACPEQYDAFIGEEQVGYLRLRHGSFRVDYPECGGKTIYQAKPQGDGIFECEERDMYLNAAKRAILHEINHSEVSFQLVIEHLEKELERQNLLIATNEDMKVEIERQGMASWPRGPMPEEIYPNMEQFRDELEQAIVYLKTKKED